MRIVRRVGKRLDADSARDIGERALAALATDQDTATLEILDRTLFGLVGGVEIILVTLHAIKQKRNPAAAALHETDPELGEAVEDTVIDQCHQRNHQRHRMVQDMGRGEVGKRFEPDAAVGAAMDGQRAAEPGRLGILHGDQRHRPQPVAHPYVHVVDIVVIGTADGGGVARVLDVADRQPLGGEQHRSVELRLVEKRKPVGGRSRPAAARRTQATARGLVGRTPRRRTPGDGLAVEPRRPTSVKRLDLGALEAGHIILDRISNLGLEVGEVAVAFGEAPEKLGVERDGGSVIDRIEPVFLVNRPVQTTSQGVPWTGARCAIVILVWATARFPTSSIDVPPRKWRMLTPFSQPSRRALTKPAHGAWNQVANM